MKKRKLGLSNRMVAQFNAKNTIDSGFDFKNNRPMIITKLSTPADWALGILELKREYNKTTGIKYFDHHTGALLVVREYIPGAKSRRKSK